MARAIDTDNLNPLSGKNLRQFLSLQGLRVLALFPLIYFLASMLKLGTSPFILACACCFGIYFAGRVAANKTSIKNSLIQHGGFFIALWLALKLFEFFSTGGTDSSPGSDFGSFRLTEHCLLVSVSYLTGFFSTLAFWYSEHALTAEIVFVALLLTGLLAGHRNYQLDAPQNFSAFAWENFFFQSNGLGPQHLLIIVGLLFALFLSIYLSLAANRPLIGRSDIERDKKKRHPLLSIALPIVVFLFFGTFAWLVNSSYTEQLARSSNGVGLKSEEGESPLGFHSAVGKTKQPAALVRLETGYDENPLGTLLYFREGALSEFNGREMVQGPVTLNPDVPLVTPGSSWVSTGESSAPSRKKIKQSVYTLVDQSNAFALDFPYSIRLIKNPDKDRFKHSYQALSLAPTIAINDLVYEPVGNPDWTPEVLGHYLRAPGSKSLSTAQIFDGFTLSGQSVATDEFGEDLRYAQKLLEIVDPMETQIGKAGRIVEYLSKASIYTRQPGHELEQGADPVAAYLFSEDKRGYCVHFAHAAVYLMRLAGIPSRIATGYMVDSTYAKDGHLLLHMGDRHAWSEIYVQGQGWVVLDVSPANAENEEAIVPDESLLEELMGKIDPAEEILDPLEPKDLSGKSDKSMLSGLIKPGMIKFAFATLLSSWLLLKWLLANLWRFQKSPASRARWAWISSSSLLADIGINRKFGETNAEFSSRMLTEHGVDLSALGSIEERRSFRGGENLNTADINQAISQTISSFDKSKGKWRRLLAFFSPLSLTRWFRW